MECFENCGFENEGFEKEEFNCGFTLPFNPPKGWRASFGLAKGGERGVGRKT